jgi:excinuclease ABC subunit B
VKSPFELVSDFAPAGDQPRAIDTLCRGLEQGQRFQILEGVTGSGKTFTIANVIARTGRPTLVISHNKTLAAQLYGELKEFFPRNAVEYFVSYYDYYQPEAYIPQTDTFIEKDASINDEIERMRLSATNALLSRNDVIIVASVSCIYGLGSPEDYAAMTVRVERGQTLDRDAMLGRLVDIQYERNDYGPSPGTFRVRGDTVDIFPSYDTHGVKIEFFGDEVESIRSFDVLTGSPLAVMNHVVLSPAKHFVMPEDKLNPAIDRILVELDQRVAWFEKQNRLLEAQRLKQRTMFDVEMMKHIGYCSGIENYSRHLSGRGEGEPPASLLSYFPGEFLTVIDESHVTLPQLRGMYNGDQARKSVLVEYGFRLPSAKDNRPLSLDEFLAGVGPIIFTTATPGRFERQVSSEPVPQVIRPTGLLDPPVEVRPLSNQVDDLMQEIRICAAEGDRALVSTLTKRTAEDLSDYLREAGLRVEYLHSEIQTIERVEILKRLREAAFDCLIGVNLLREGLDLPEVALVAILDADKEGFLRSETSLVQTAGRTARHVRGRVILYADRVTDSMKAMMDVTSQRREHQLAYNRARGITPRRIEKRIRDGLVRREQEDSFDRAILKEARLPYDVHNAIREIEKEMLEAAAKLEFERAAALRDELQDLKRGIDNKGKP